MGIVLLIETVLPAITISAEYAFKFVGASARHRHLHSWETKSKSLLMPILQLHQDSHRGIGSSNFLTLLIDFINYKKTLGLQPPMQLRGIFSNRPLVNHTAKIGESSAVKASASNVRSIYVTRVS